MDYILDLPINSPLIPQGAYNAIALLKALQNLEIVITDATGVAHKGTISISKTNAVLSVKL